MMNIREYARRMESEKADLALELEKVAGNWRVAIEEREQARRELRELKAAALELVNNLKTARTLALERDCPGGFRAWSKLYNLLNAEVE